MVKLYKYSLESLSKKITTFHIPEEIKDKQWAEAYKVAKNSQPLPQPVGDYDLENSEFYRKLLQQPDQSQVYVYWDWDLEQIKRLLTEGNCYQLAKEFASESFDGSIDEKEIQKIRDELDGYVKELQKNGYEEADLKKWLKEAKKPFLDAILTSLNAELQLIETPSTTKKRKELVKLVKDDLEKIAQIKYYYDKSQSDREIIEASREELEEIKEKYDEVRESLNELIDEQKENLDTLVNYCVLQLNDNQQEVIKSQETKIEKKKAQKLRERIRYQGLLAYAQGVAAATIDGIAPQYIQAAQQIGDGVRQASQNIVDTCPSQGVEAGSYEQTKLVLDGTKNTSISLIQAFAKEDTLKVKYTLSQSDVPQVELNGGVKQKQKV